MAIVQIPLSSSPHQSFTATVSVDGKNIVLSFYIRFSELAGYWLMDVGNADTGKTLLASIPLVPGISPAANILGQYAYLAIGSAYLLPATATSEEHPGEETLGTTWVLLWGDTV